MPSILFNKSNLIVALALGFSTTLAQATPVLTLSAKIVSRRIVGTPFPVETINSSQYLGPPSGGTFDYQIEIDASIANLDPGNSFGSLAFDVSLGNDGNIKPPRHW